MIKIKLFFVIALLIIFVNPVLAITIPYGKSGKIIYNLKNGTFDIYENSLPVLQGGFSTVMNHDKLLNSKNYLLRSYAKMAINDQFGKGTKHVITLKGSGFAEMQQIFYTYEHRSYFLCELVITGTALTSNQIHPIQGVLLAAGQGVQALKSLYVPFDNDTFISYNAKDLAVEKSNISAEVTALYNNTSRNGVVMGSVAHEIWKTGVKTSRAENNRYLLDIQVGYTAPELTRDTIPHGSIKGNQIKSAMIFFGSYQDWRTGMEEYAKANRFAEPPIVSKWNQSTPVGWNSWGAMQDKISFGKATQVVDFFADSLTNFRSDGTAFIDLDSYWDKMIKGGLEGDYSELKAFADYTKKKGLKPGVYWAPFTDWGYKSGAGRRAEGGNYKFGDLWTKVGTGYHDIDGARALDPTHPGTRQRIALVIGKLKECGFEMIKVDFLGHAAIESDRFYDSKITTGMQAYKAGMEYLLEQLDGKMLVYAAITPNMASGRYVHVRRIACDAFKSINDTKYTLNSLTNGWWQTYLYDYIDADHVVFSDETDGANRARLVSSVITGTLILGDDYSVKGQWSAQAKKLVQHPQLLEIVKDGKSFRPVEGDNGKGASPIFIKQVGNVYYVAMFNYEKSPAKIKISLERLGLPAKEVYQASDILGAGKELLNNDTVIDLDAGSAKIFKVMVYNQ